MIAVRYSAELKFGCRSSADLKVTIEIQGSGSFESLDTFSWFSSQNVDRAEFGSQLPNALWIDQGKTS